MQIPKDSCSLISGRVLFLGFFEEITLLCAGIPSKQIHQLQVDRTLVHQDRPTAGLMLGKQFGRVEGGYFYRANLLSKSVTQTFHAKIYVTLRPSVLDPAGTAVQSGLSHLGYDNVDRVRIGKYVELNIEAEDKASAKSQLDRVCDQLLANPVIENYRFDLEETAVSAGGAQ